MKKVLIILIALLIPVAAMTETLDELTSQRDSLLIQLTGINEQIAQIRKTESPAGSIGRICDIFPDEGMAITVRDACGKFSIEQEVTAEDLAKVKSVDPAYGLKIHDLTGIGYLTELVSLSIDWEQGEFEEFPDEMKNCLQLSNIIVDSSRLNKLPDWIGELTELWIIDIRGNAVSVIPDSLCNLTKLYKLDISYNKAISELPKNIGNLSSLKELNISNTGITSLPESIYALDLNEINMDNLPIK